MDRGHEEHGLGEQWFASLASTIGVFRVAWGRGIVWANDRIVEIVGHPLDEVLGDGWQGIVHADDLSRLTEAVDAQAAEPHPAQMELRIVRPDGETRWVRMRIAPIEDTGREPGFAGAVEDLTDAVDAATEAARLGAAVQASSDFVVITDASGRVRYLNPTARDLYGLGEEVALDLTTRDLYAPESLARVQTEMLLGLVRETRWTGEVELAGRDGSRVPVSLVATLERGADDAAEHIVMVARDLRPERALVEEASRSDQQFRMLAEASPFGIVEITAEAEVAYVNRRYCEIAGRSEDEVRELVLTGGMLPPEDRDDIVDHLSKAFVARQAVEGLEHQIVRPDGERVWARARTTPVFSEGGRFHGYVATVEDISAEMDERASIDRLVRIFDATPDYASIVDDAGRILFLNPAARELLGIAPDGSVEDLDPRSFYAARSIPVLDEEAAPALEEHGVWTGEVVLVAHDGRELTTLQTTVVSQGADGSTWYASISRDIAPLKEAEARIAQSEARFRALVTHASDMVLVFDADGQMSYASPSVHEFVGLDPDSSDVQPSQIAWLHPEDRDRALRIIASVVAEGGTCPPFEMRVRHRSGQWRWLEVVATNLLDDPAVAGVVTNARDVTERVEAATALREINEALHKSNDTLRAVFENSPLAIYTFDVDGTVKSWNPACEALFGYTAEEAVGGPSPIRRRGEPRAADDLRRRVLDGEVIQPAEVRRYHRDGHEIDVRVAAAPMRGADGQVDGILVLASDITAEKEQARALRENEARFHALAEHASVIITILEADGTVRYTSPSAERILGYPEGFGYGTSVFDYVHPEDRDRIAGPFARLVLEPGSSETVRFRMADAAGEWRDVEATGDNLMDDPAVHGILITSRDVTEQVAAERAVRASEERFRALVQNLSDIVTIIDEDGSVRWTSPAVERILGHTPEEVVAAGPLGLIHPDDQRSMVEMILHQMDEPGPHEPFTLRVRHADGSWRSIEAVLDDLRDNPAVAGLVITSRDATESLEAEARLAASEARYRGIVEDQTELLCRYRSDGTLTFVNEAFARYFDMPVDELVGSRHRPFIPEEDRERIGRGLATLGSHNPAVTVEHRILRPDGALRWHEWTHRVVLDADGAVVEYGALGRDITEQREAEMLVADQARVLEMIARGAPLTETLEELCLVLESHAGDVVCSVLLVDETAPDRLRCGGAPSLPESFVQHLDVVPIGPRSGSCGTAAYLGEAVVVTDVGADPLWAELRQVPLTHGVRAAWSYPIKAASHDRVVGTFCLYSHDARGPSRRHEQLVEMVVHHAAIAIERKQFEAQLAHQAHHDPLTGLPNRVLFMEFLVLALARARRYRSTVAVLFLDLDRFKVINDSLGHDTGDEVLLALGQRLRSVLRPGDTVARFGGDEFTILCEDLSGPQARQQAVEVAERLLEVVHQPFLLGGEEHFVSASVGIALAGGGDDRPEELLRDADAAMYRAKERGKGRWELFDESMRQSALRRLEIERALHRAIDRGEFRVFYQPCVSVADGRCVGAEALVRWQHPERGLVAPLEFIELAEETGLVVPLGRWVLEEACRQAARWWPERAHDDQFQVSVNLSGRQLGHPDVVEHVAEALERTGVDPALMCLEITESVLMEDVEATITKLSGLRELGVRLGVDDFGTGYSSLGYLKRFPVEIVKVDQSFVGGLGTDAEDSAIVAAVVGLSHALGMQVVAEGVETELQLAELKALACDQAQGYLFAPPQAAADVDEIVTGSGLRLPGGSQRSP